MSITCAVLECCDNSSVRAIIYSSDSSWPTGGFTQGLKYSVSYAGKSSCFNAIYVSNPCNYSGSYGYTVNTGAIVNGGGGGSGFTSCGDCDFAEPKIGVCTDVLVPLPSPSVTPSKSITPTPTTSIQYNTPLVVRNCCDSSDERYVSGPSNYIIGQTGLIGSVCFEIIASGGPGGNNFIPSYYSCSHCSASNPCPSPTPSITPTNTPSKSITPTPPLSKTPSKTPPKTPSVSVTPTITQTPSVSVTPTITQTPSVSVTPTITQTPSVSVTPTITQTPSVSVTPTITQTPSTSGLVSVSVTPTITQTPSITPTLSVTPSITPTLSVTPSVSTSITPTLTPSTSGAVSVSVTPTVTQTPSITATLSVTPSVTPSVSTSISTTPTVTITMSITPTVSETPPATVTPSISVSVTPSITPTNTPTVTPSISFTPTLSPTPSVTPSSFIVGVTGTSTFNMFNQPFDCNSVAKLSNCDTGDIYYVAEYLAYSGSPITTGDTFGAIIQDVNGTNYVCVSYDEDVSGSANAYILSIDGVYGSCYLCTPPQQPSPTPSITPSITVTPTVSTTPTPTPSPSLNTPLPVFVYSACTGPQNVMGLGQQVPGVTIGQTFRYGGRCWNYVGQFNQPYSPPSGTIYATSATNLFGTPSNIYSNCSACVASPSPSPTPTPTPSTSGVGCNAHTVIWNWTHQCPLCDVVGSSLTVYTDSTTTVLSDGDTIYTNCSRTIPVASGRFIKTSQGNVFSVTTGGVIYLECVAGYGC